MATNTNLKLVCDEGEESSWVCHVSLFLQFSTFELHALTEKKEMTYAGAVFSLIQVVTGWFPCKHWQDKVGRVVGIVSRYRESCSSAWTR